jgi:hypothetical protein
LKIHVPEADAGVHEAVRRDRHAQIPCDKSAGLSAGDGGASARVNQLTIIKG